MAISLSSAVIAEKNRLGSTESFLLALEIAIPGVAEPVRVVRNTENVTWRGHLWVAFPFELEEIGESSKGEVPRVEVRVSNVSRAMESYIQEYDAWVKNNGFTPITCDIFVLNTVDLANSEPVVRYVFELRQPKTDARWCTFVLGAYNPFDRRFPPAFLLQNACRYRFKAARCGYSGAATACDKTFARCRELGNTARFGGAPGIGSGGLYE